MIGMPNRIHSVFLIESIPISMLARRMVRRQTLLEAAAFWRASFFQVEHVPYQMALENVETPKL